MTDNNVLHHELSGRLLCKYCKRSRAGSWRASKDWAQQHGYIGEDGINRCCHSHGIGGWGIIGGCIPQPTISARIRMFFGRDVATSVEKAVGWSE